MYREVAEEPFKEFHFETGRPLAERLGYAPAALDAIPAEAIDTSRASATTSTSRLSGPVRSSSIWAAAPGMDSFLAARQVGETGRVIGVDMTERPAHEGAAARRPARLRQRRFR